MAEEEIVMKPKVFEVDMPDAMQKVAFEFTAEAQANNKIDKDIATAIKKKFDAHEEYGGTWHCIVGKNFGCSITHETQFSVFFQLNGSYILLFKSIE